MPMRRPNIVLKDQSFFLKILEAKVRFDPDIAEDCQIKMKQIEQLFLDLNYSLTGRQLNDLFLH